jgi:hypothetical protein
LAYWWLSRWHEELLKEKWEEEANQYQRRRVTKKCLTYIEVFNFNHWNF